ncbi:hypothetical protein RvY_04228-1 [Ramazzottius varieornatus]|uniref:Receptor ligand binding region domain-containing protein n=1 Tax=Ramazzottius varieornatus TaxID=947166 RepID=A0A1D1UUA2_RAMVA|nr:hypothetical protein RvY_04228-1 [Ramazzottius varieornatus]
MATGVLQFMDQFKWRTATLICDSLTQYPGLSTFVITSCTNLRMLQQSRRSAYNFFNLDLNSAVTQDYTTFLQQAKLQSRIVILVTHPKIMRDILLAAYAMNMTDGEYMFLAAMSTSVPTRGPITWKFQDGEDKVAFEAFKSVITYSNIDPNWREVTDWTDQIASTASTRFNLTLPNEHKYNDFAISAFEIMLASAEVRKTVICQTPWSNFW